MDYLPPVQLEMPTCIKMAADRQRLPVVILKALEKVEDGRIGMFKRNANGTIDHGPMQINTTWTKFFRTRYAIQESELANDRCLGYEAAAFVVRYEINRCKGDFWCGVGHYHSQDPKRAREYVTLVANAAAKLGASIEGSM